MALRLRRGTDAERLLITPVEGELIYTTDTKQLYAGDGTTAGGTLVTSAGGGVTSLDALTDTDLTGAVGDDVLAYNAGTSKWEAVAVPGISVIALNDLSDVDTAGLTAADIIQYDGVNFITTSVQEAVGVGGALTIQTTGTHTGDVIGNVIGTLDGDVTGSVFGDDSTLIIDGVSNSIVSNSIAGNTISTTQLNATSPSTGVDDKDLRIYAEGINIIGYNGTLLQPTALSPGDTVGYVSFASTYDSSGENKLAAATFASWDATADLSSGAPRANLSWGIGDNGSDVNIVATLDYTGNFSANIITPGTYADSTARDAAITTPTAGMMVFVTDVAKFQGYDGSAWVNLN